MISTVAALLLACHCSMPGADSLRAQVTKYGLIATPYCGDEEIARVAHSYGWHREAATVHTNPLSKVYICQTLGYDWRSNRPAADI